VTDQRDQSSIETEIAALRARFEQLRAQSEELQKRSEAMAMSHGPRAPVGDLVSLADPDRRAGGQAPMVEVPIGSS
jgi:hypothetical protein